MLVQNVFINLINKYLGLLTIELSYKWGPNNIFIYLYWCQIFEFLFICQYSNVRHPLASPGMQEILKRNNI